VGLTTLFTPTLPVYGIVLILVVLGYGNGQCLQPTIIALQAHCTKSQRAVVISVRNFLRCLGGAIGLAVSAAVLQNVLRAQLPANFKYLAKTTYAKPDYSKFSTADGELILEAYAKASRAVFIFMVPCAAIALASFSFVPDRGLTRPEEPSSKPAVINTENEEKNIDIEKQTATSPMPALGVVANEEKRDDINVVNEEK
jgi:MFS family permease